jgi:ABC-type branched-subunit amino acid transport system permease subunit
MSLYLTSTLVLVILAAITGLALNLQWGLGGLINFGLFGFYMLAAYATGLLTHAGLPPLLAMAISLAITALVSALVSQIAIRLSEDYLAIVTLGFAECLRLLVMNEDWLTRGVMGLAGIVRPFHGAFGGRAPDAVFLLFCGACLLVVFVVYELIARSPLGRALRGIRDDPLVIETLGKHVQRIRWKTFALGGAMVGVAGSLHAFYYSYIDPTQFTTIITAYAFIAVLMGGRGSARGVLLSSFSVILLLEGSRFVNDQFSFIDAAQLASLRFIMVGVVIIAIIRFKPEGFVAEYRLKLATKTPEGKASKSGQ